MRFDEKLAASLAQPEGDPDAVAAKWCALAELLARRDGKDDGPEVEQALAFLRRRSGDIPADTRDQVACSMPSAINPQLADLFTQSQALPARTSPSFAEGEAHIRDLVSRVEAFRSAKQAGETLAESFRWEAGPEGVILWVEGAPRGPLVGQSIASPAADGECGVDGQAAGAFGRRSPFRDARMTVSGCGPASGDWRLSGVPFFDPGQGHFMGFRGSARRPRIDEVAPTPQNEKPAGLFGTELPPDALRQLIHELRTPLNAIMGFAEMIDGQYLGPAADSYRARASRIREQAGHLLSAVDDLDTAARIETSRLPPVEQSSVDAVALLYRLHESYDRVAQQRYATLRMEFAPDLPLAKVEADAAERMFSRMLAATIGLSEEGETLTAELSLEDTGGKKMLCLAIARPRSIQGLEEAQLLDPGYTPAGDWPAAPALGLGFALRLVRNLAEAAGGTLTIENERFLLALPPLESNGGAASRSG